MFDHEQFVAGRFRAPTEVFMRRVALRLTAVACVIAIPACADSTGPQSAKTAPATVSRTRYILASGETMPANCRDLGNGLWLCEDNQLAPEALVSTSSSDNENGQ